MSPRVRLFAAVGLFLLLWAVLTGAVIAWQLFFLWGSLVLTAALILRYWASNLTCSVMLRPIEGVHGGHFEITYVFANNGLLPIPVCRASVHLGEELGFYELSPEELSFSVSEMKAVRKQFTCPRRGIYAVGGTTVVIPDLLGLRTRAVHYEKKITAEVFPREYPVTSLRGSGREEGGSLRSRSDAEQDYSSISRLRQALPQESVRHIHWKASARTQALLVREYERCQRPGVIVILDADGHKYTGDLERKVEDRCVEVAAGLVSHWLGRGYSVDLLTGSGPPLHLSGAQPLESALRVLMVFRPQLQAPLDRELSRLWRERRQGALLQVVTPALSTEETARLLEASAGRVVVFRVGEAPGPAVGNLPVIRVPV